MCYLIIWAILSNVVYTLNNYSIHNTIYTYMFMYIVYYVYDIYNNNGYHCSVG